jgi:hypothetical protein
MDWEAIANRILFALAYFDERRGFKPMGELLTKCLDVKWELVKLARDADYSGKPWTIEEFGDVCFDNFEKLLA